MKFIVLIIFLSEITLVVLGCQCPCLSKFEFLFQDAIPEDFATVRFGTKQCICRMGPVGRNPIINPGRGEPTSTTVPTSTIKPTVSQLYFSSGCKEFQAQRDKRHVLTSPNFPKPYPEGTPPAVCLVSAPEGWMIRAKFTKRFNVGTSDCEDGHVILLSGFDYEESSMVRCGPERTPFTYTTTENMLLIDFDPGSESWAGFRAVLEVI